MNKILFLLTIFLIFSCSKEETSNGKKPEVFALSTSVSPSDGGSITGVSETYNDGEEVELTATPSEDFEFREWQGDISGSENPINFIMSSDKEVVAVFEEKVYSLDFDIIGKWYVQNAKSNNAPSVKEKMNKQSNNSSCSVDSIEFREDGTFILITDEGEVNGQFVVDGDGSIDFGVGKIEELSFIDDVLNFKISLNSGCSSTVSALLLTYIPNDAFENELIKLGHDNTLDNFVKTKEIRTVTTLRLGPSQEIIDFTGLEDFRDLELLDVMIHDYSSEFLQNRTEIEIDLTSNSNLKYLELYGVGVKSLNLENNHLLERVFLYYSELSGAISFPDNPLLREVAINANSPQPRVNINLDFTHNPNLELFSSDDTWIGKLDISRSLNMRYLSVMEYVDELIMSGIYDKMLTLEVIGSSPYHRPINLENFPNLEIIRLFYEEPLTFTAHAGLKELLLSYNKATSIDLSQNPELYKLDLGMEELSALQLANNEKLSYLQLSAPLSTLDISKNTDIRSIALYETDILLFDISQNLNLERLTIKNFYNTSQLECVQVNEEQEGKIENGQITDWDIGDAQYSTNCN